MNKKEINELSYFPKELDNAVNKKFGESVNCKSEYSFLDGTYKTYYHSENDEQNVKIDLFIQGYIAGNQELSNRLLNLKN